MTIRTATTMTWKWGSSAEGTVADVHHDDVSRTTNRPTATRGAATSALHT